MRRRLISARLIRLLKIARESASYAYDEPCGLAELPRQIIVLIGNHGEATSSDLVALTGQEKAQISRAVKALEADRMIERASRRAPLLLTDQGRLRFEAIMDVARARGDAFSVGLREGDIEHLQSMTRTLTERAATLFTHERQATAEAAERAGLQFSEPPLPDYRKGYSRGRSLAATIIPALHALLSYMRRSASLVYRREHDLSHFEWMVLSQIGEHQPVTQARLVEMMRRNKSQIGRTIAFLEKCGLISRRPHGAREKLLRTTEEGWNTYVSMCGLAIGREDFLLAENTRQDRERYMAMLDQITTNAELLLAREMGLKQVQQRQG